MIMFFRADFLDKKVLKITMTNKKAEAATSTFCLALFRWFLCKIS